MSEHQAPYSFDSDAGNALRRAAAAAADNPEMAQALHIAAAYIETAIDQVAGRAQTAIGNIEIKVREQVAETHNMVRSLGEFLQQLQVEQRAAFGELRAGQQGIAIDIGIQGGVLGGLQAQVTELQGMFSTLGATVAQITADVAGLHATLNAQRKSANDRYATLQRDLAALWETVNGLAAELKHVRERTIADELTADDRRRLTEINRWLQERQPQLAALLEWWNERVQAEQQHESPAA